MGKVTGFASPAQGYEENAIDLNTLLIKHRSSTYLFPLETADMVELGLPKGSLLLVDKSKNAEPGNLVILLHEGNFICRLYFIKNGVRVFTDGQNITVPIVDDTAIVGVVTACIQIFNCEPSKPICSLD